MNNNQGVNQGVFHWIRESVRRSVLLGFSDAVEQLGVPTGEAADVSPHVMAVLKHTNASPSLPSPDTVATATATATSPAKPERKRLGRSLDQLRDTSAK